MNDVKQPTKEQIRQYMQQRREAKYPPPSMQEIRRQLGWELVHAVTLPILQTA